MKTLQNKLGALALCSLLCVSTMAVGCQSTLAALTTVLGNAAASVASLEGNTALATQLQTDTAAATKAIQNWKQGTPAQNVVQALQVVEDDLNLVSQIPGAEQYAPLIALALSTAISIIEIVQPGSAPQLTANVRIAGVQAEGAPKTAAEFKARWNSIAQSNSNMAKAVLK